MTDLDELIAEAKSRMKGEINMPGRVFLSGVINALEAAGAERDAALAAIDRARAVCLHLGGVDGDVSQPAPSYYVSVGRNAVATEVLAALDGAPEPDREYHLTEVETKREMTNPVYVLRGGVYLLDEHAGVLIDSAGNFSAKTKGNPRSLAVLLKAIAESIEDDVAWLPVEGECRDD